MRVGMAASLSTSPYTCSRSSILRKGSPKIKAGRNCFRISASTSVLAGGSPLLQAAKHTVRLTSNRRFSTAFLNNVSTYTAFLYSTRSGGCVRKKWNDYWLGIWPSFWHGIQYLGRLLRTGALKDIVGIPMSITSASEAAKSGIPLDNFNDSSQIDFSFDDADIIEEGTLIAVIGHRNQVEDSIIQEKSILNASNQLAFMIKESQYLNGPEGSIPVLVNALNWMQTAEEIDDLFLGDAEVWRRPSIGHAGPLGGEFPLITREGHNILDVIFTSPISSLAEVAESLNQIDGVVNHGVISKFPCTVVIASESGLQIVDNLQRNMA